MSRKPLVIYTLAGLALIAIAVYLLALRPAPVDDRTQVLRLIADAERAIEQKRPSDLMALISNDYSDDRGNDRRSVQRLVIAGARQRGNIDLSVQVTDITVKGDTATFTAEVDYAYDGPVGADATSHLTVRGRLRREGRRWRVVKAEGWQDAESAYLQ